MGHRAPSPADCRLPGNHPVVPFSAVSRCWANTAGDWPSRWSRASSPACSTTISGGTITSQPLIYGTFSPSDQWTRIIILGAATLLASETVRRAQRLRYLSTHDRLTGLSNRRHLEERAAIELERARRHRRVVAIAMVDVDHFKKFNDSFGHTAGDVVLRMIASTIRDNVRASDAVARYGGEEFVLIFPEAAEAEALDRLDAIRECISRSRVVIGSHPNPHTVTVSGGLAMFPADGHTLEAVLDVADKRLFEAKQTGRDRATGSTGLRRPRVEA